MSDTRNGLLSRHSLAHAAATPTTRLAGCALDEGDGRLAQPEQLVDCMVDLTLDCDDVAVSAHAGVGRQGASAVGRRILDAERSIPTRVGTSGTAWSTVDASRPPRRISNALMRRIWGARNSALATMPLSSMCLRSGCALLTPDLPHRRR